MVKEGWCDKEKVSSDASIAAVVAVVVIDIKFLLFIYLIRCCSYFGGYPHFCILPGLVVKFYLRYYFCYHFPAYIRQPERAAL